MGDNATSQICFGIIFEEEYEFPWDKVKKHIDDWWIEDVLRFKPSFEIYNEDGEYIDGKRPDEKIIDKYYDERAVFIETNKRIPIELINYCSGNEPMYIIAIPGKIISSEWGEPEKINNLKLICNIDDERILINFCKEFKIKHKDKPAWYLISCYG